MNDNTKALLEHLDRLYESGNTYVIAGSLPGRIRMAEDPDAEAEKLKQEFTEHLAAFLKFWRPYLETLAAAYAEMARQMLPFIEQLHEYVMEWNDAEEPITADELPSVYTDGQIKYGVEIQTPAIDLDVARSVALGVPYMNRRQR